MLTQQHIADHLDLERSTVSRLVDRLNIDYRTASLDEIRVAYIRHLRESAAGRASETGIDLVAERAMTERVDREIKLLTLAEKKGQLVNAAQLERAYGQMVGAFQTELLALPDKLVQELRTLYGVEVDVEWLNEHMYGCLQQLSEYDADGPHGDSPDRAASASARADRDDGLGAQASSDEREGDGDAGPL
ncbi:helix-turn-helix domain-containing protein [Burkholderia cenocepacia]|uniref:helix-turn-helix domain-containing protein n=1 Tax=Burkholderia cenocepacia TaxID=95486 RepID=UPI00286613A9|nr:helix-turn-helix domain-containing protein [Burkholderia cenocepacia]MDR8058774.1 MarR family transcriptional regulator [Burkholderia cenocepacia]MDR8061138.1 MarR family transcriptional regulator [Burkholderia cenocepacia]